LGGVVDGRRLGSVTPTIMAGLDPAISLAGRIGPSDTRIEPAHDGEGSRLQRIAFMS
jgi:hypothetical protein